MSRRRDGQAGPECRAVDPYAVLGVERRAAAAEIKRAYFQGVRDHPPEQDPEGFQEIRAAYERLRTPEARSLTDLFLVQPPPDPPRRRRLPAPDLEVHREDVTVLAWAWLLARLAAGEEFREPPTQQWKKQ